MRRLIASFDAPSTHLVGNGVVEDQLNSSDTMATAIRTCRQHYSDRRSPSPFLMASSASAP